MKRTRCETPAQYNMIIVRGCVRACVRARACVCMCAFAGHFMTSGVDHWLEQYNAQPPKVLIEDEANYENLK